MGLEGLIQRNLGDDVAQEYRKSIDNYFPNLKSLLHDIWPATVASIIGAGLGQTIYSEFIGNDVNWATAAGYIGGSILGYPTFFALHYSRNKEEYEGIEGKMRFGKFASDFIISDWIGDLLGYTPVYVLADQSLSRSGTLDSGSSAAVATCIGAVSYTLFLAASMPVVSAVTEIANKKIKQGVQSFSDEVKGALYECVSLTSKEFPLSLSFTRAI